MLKAATRRAGLRARTAAMARCVLWRATTGGKATCRAARSNITARSTVVTYSVTVALLDATVQKVPVKMGRPPAPASRLRLCGPTERVCAVGGRRLTVTRHHDSDDDTAKCHCDSHAPSVIALLARFLRYEVLYQDERCLGIDHADVPQCWISCLAFIHGLEAGRLLAFE